MLDKELYDKMFDFKINIGLFVLVYLDIIYVDMYKIKFLEEERKLNLFFWEKIVFMEEKNFGGLFFLLGLMMFEKKKKLGFFFFMFEMLVKSFVDFCLKLKFLMIIVRVIVM